MFEDTIKVFFEMRLDHVFEKSVQPTPVLVIHQSIIIHSKHLMYPQPTEGKTGKRITDFAIVTALLEHLTILYYYK